MIFEQLTLDLFQDQISGHSDSPVKISLLQETNVDSRENDHLSFSQLQIFFERSKKKIPADSLPTCSLRMLKTFYQSMGDGISSLPSLNWMKSGMTVNGSYSTLKISEFPKIENEYLLSDILEEDVPEKYFLSEEKAQKLIVNSYTCLDASYYKGLDNHGARTGVLVRPVLTPDRVNKRQNGRRMKDYGEPMFTLTTQDRHGIYDGYRIRKLTPRECFRLQGFPDWCFDRAQAAGISDSQLYKQAGNSVTVNVIYEIARRMGYEKVLGSCEI